MEIGSRVSIVRNSDSHWLKAKWWPESGLTGTVQRICKNGSVYIAVDQIRNSSEDGKQTRVFDSSDKVTLVLI